MKAIVLRGGGRRPPVDPADSREMDRIVGSDVMDSCVPGARPMTASGAAADARLPYFDWRS